MQHYITRTRWDNCKYTNNCVSVYFPVTFSLPLTSSFLKLPNNVMITKQRDKLFHVLTAVGALMTLIDFTLSNARRFYSSIEKLNQYNFAAQPEILCRVTNNCLTPILLEKFWICSPWFKFLYHRPISCGLSFVHTHFVYIIFFNL